MLTDAQRDLVTQHVGIAVTRAQKVAAKLPLADREDIHSVAKYGLCLAARDFDPARGVPFYAYACMRVKGAIVDAVRKRQPLGYRQPRKECVVPAIHSVTDLTEAQLPGAPNADLEHAEVAEEIAAWRSGLSEEEAAVVNGVFFEDRPLRRAPEWLGHTYRRAMRLQGSALGALRKRLTLGAPC